MNIDEQIIQQIKSAKDADEMLALADEAGVRMSREQAQAIVDRLHGKGSGSNDDNAFWSQLMQILSIK